MKQAKYKEKNDSEKPPHLSALNQKPPGLPPGCLGAVCPVLHYKGKKSACNCLKLSKIRKLTPVKTGLRVSFGPCMCSGMREGEDDITKSSLFSTCWPLATSSVVSKHYPRRATKHTHFSFSFEKDLFMVFSDQKRLLQIVQSKIIPQSSFPQIYKCPNHSFSLQHCLNTFAALCAYKVKKRCHSNLQKGDETEDVQSQINLSGHRRKRHSHHCLQNPELLNQHQSIFPLWS